MIHFPGTSVFATQNLNPAVNSNVANVRATVEKVSAQAAGAALANATIGIAKPSIDQLKGSNVNTWA